MFTTNDYFLIGAIAIYLAISVAIGVLAAVRVKNSTDYIVAGHKLPLIMVVTTVFATWFGSETVLGTSATFVTEGLGGIVADPFGAALCLILVGVFFAVPLYRLNLLTIGDYYKRRYGRDIEVMTSIVIILSYLGWVAAQLAALGLVFNVISHGLIDVPTGMVIGVIIVLVHTIFGGMWSVAITDFIQMLFVTIGLVFITWVITGKIDGGAATVIEHAREADKFNFFPQTTWAGWLGFIGALMTLGLGSIPQQDVFQRVMSANSAKNARLGSIIGGVMYFLFAMLPLYLAYSAFIMMPDMVNKMLSEGGDSQMVLPTLIMQNTPVFAQIIFFGALLSAIMSTASATLLAPSSIFSENILRRFFSAQTEKRKLLYVRLSVLVFSIFVTIYALNSDKSIFNMVEDAYKVVLVGAFAPLAFGLYWQRASLNGARVSIIAGVSVWLIFEWLEKASDGVTNWAVIGYPDLATVCPPQLAGFVASVAGIVIGSLIWPNKNPPLTPQKEDIPVAAKEIGN